jgi:hypothetical protein
MVDETRATTRKQGDGWHARLSAEDAIHGQQQPANFAVDLMHNDITLGLDEFGEHPMFLGQVVRQIYNTAREGLGDKYSTSVYRHSSHWPGGWNSHAVPGASVTPS